MKWAYGMTTVPSRIKDGLTGRTLKSLARAGFDKPRVFVDGPLEPSKHLTDLTGLELTNRCPPLKTYGNWILGLAELYLRNPAADRYAMFQDDFVCVSNLRTYLEKCPYPERSYLNLYTAKSNLAFLAENHLTDKTGWHPSNQFGRGAVALVFDLPAVLTLLTYQGPRLPDDKLMETNAHRFMVERPMDVMRGTRNIDGGIVTAFKRAGYTEYIHNPTLIQHEGKISTMFNPPRVTKGFLGEEYDALGFLKSPAVA